MEIPEAVCKASRAVLLSNSKGVLLKNFTKDYKTLLGEDFPWKTLGYESPLEMLRAMKNSALLKYDEGDNDYRVFGIATGHSYLSTPLMKAQWSEQKEDLLKTPSKSSKNDKKDAHCRHTRDKTKVRKNKAEGEEGLVVCIRFKDRPGADWRCKYWRKPLIHDLMINAGHVTHMFIPKKLYYNYGFVHFSTLQEARNAIDMFHNSRYHGVQLLVTWATPNPKGSSNTYSEDDWLAQIFPGPHPPTSPGPHPPTSPGPHPPTSPGPHPPTSPGPHPPTSPGPHPPTSPGPHPPTSLGPHPPTSPGPHPPTSLGPHPPTSPGPHPPTSPGPYAFVDERVSDELHYNYSNESPSLKPGSSSGTSPLSRLQHLVIQAEVDDTREETLSHSNSSIDTNDLGVYDMVHSPISEVTVTEVDSPSYFFVQTSPTIQQDITNLSDSIERSRPMPLTTALTEGEIYCICEKKQDHVNRRWIRLVLTKINEHLKQATGLDVDTGHTLTTRLVDLYHLPQTFSVLTTPPMALPCSLHCVMSTHVQGWWPSDCQLLWKLTRSKVYAVFKRHPAILPAVCTVELYLDSSKTQNIAQILNDRGTFVLYYGTEGPAAQDTLAENLDTAVTLRDRKSPNGPCDRNEHQDHHCLLYTRSDLSQRAHNQPDLPQRAHNQPDLSQRAHHQPDLPQRTHNQPDLPQRAHHQPDLPQRAHHQPDLPQRAHHQPDLSQRTHNQPDLSQRAHNQPDLPQRTHNQPDLPQRAHHQPDLPQRAHHQPDLPQRAHNQPHRSYDSCSEETHPGTQNSPFVRFLSALHNS